MARLHFNCKYCGKMLRVSEVIWVNKSYDEDGTEHCDCYVCNDCGNEVDEVIVEPDEG